MLKTSTRPRAPSAATLRVLYQLAYISSGTAVGIGALCAEERRRRTQIVQKVADNARRIRQSPRYAHGAAAAALKQQDSEDSPIWLGRETGSESPAHDANPSGAGELDNFLSAKIPELPSVVEEGYGQLIQGNRKKGRRRNGTGRPDFVEEHGSRESSAKAKLNTRGNQQARSSRRSVVLSSPMNSGPERPARRMDLEKNVLGKNPSAIVYKRLMRHGEPLQGDLKPEPSRRTIFHATEEGSEHRDPDDYYDTIASLFSTHRLWTGQPRFGRFIPTRILKPDVDLFFRSVDADAVPRISKANAGRIADELLRLSLRSDEPSMSEIRSLLLWKLYTNELSIDDLYDTAAALAKITRELGPEATKQFYHANLFTTRPFQTASPSDKLSIRLRLHAEALRLDTLDDDTGLYEQLTESSKVPINVTDDQLAALIERECGRLLGHGDLTAAVKLWCMSMRTAMRTPRSSDLCSKLREDLWAAAIKGRHLALCAQMLRTRDGFVGQTSDGVWKDAFIRVCYEEGAVGMLRTLFGRPKSDALSDTSMLSAQSCAILCQCFVHQNRSFQTYYRRLPFDLRASVADARMGASASTLKAEWKSSRNLDSVRAKYEDQLKHTKKIDDFLLETTQIDRSADVRLLHVAMIEIELSANQPIEAIETLSKLNKEGTDSTVAMLTALALAKQRKWLDFGRLFEALKQDPTAFQWSKTSIRAYNNALHIFSLSHTAQELSDFVLMTVNELRFFPNHSTWEILMSSLVSKNDIPLLKYWIKLSGVIHGNIKMNADIAAALMKSWYMDFRHSHVLVIWFCRELSLAAPALYGEKLLSVVRQTIAFDLRKLRGVNAPWMEPIIRARQALFQTVSDFIPKPGYIYDRQLFADRGHLLTANGILASSQAADEEADLSTPLELETYQTAEDEDFLSTLSDPGAYQTAQETDALSAAQALVPRQESGEDDKAYDVVEPIEPARSYKAQTLSSSNAAHEFNTITAPETVDASFDSLRPSYESIVTSEPGADRALELPEIEKLERQMVQELSTGHNDAVIELYQNSLDAVGLPASPITLEIAVDASLRNTGDGSEAENILSDARDAGMNVTCAMGPLIIHQIRHNPIADAESAAKLRSDVIEYYRMNELNGLHVKHRVGVSAASKLIQVGFPEHGINLLDTISRSTWSAAMPLDIVAMGVWLLGYASLHHESGMRWVVEQVLKEDMKITQGFIWTLKRARRPVVVRGKGATYKRHTPELTAELFKWHEACAKKRMEQMRDSNIFGRKLIRLLATAKNTGKPRTGVDMRSMVPTDAEEPRVLEPVASWIPLQKLEPQRQEPKRKESKRREPKKQGPKSQDPRVSKPVITSWSPAQKQGRKRQEPKRQGPERQGNRASRRAVSWRSIRREEPRVLKPVISWVTTVECGSQR